MRIFSDASFKLLVHTDSLLKPPPIDLISYTYHPDKMIQRLVHQGFNHGSSFENW